MNHQKVEADMTAVIMRLIQTEPDFKLISEDPLNYQFGGKHYQIEFLKDEDDLLIMETTDLDTDDILTYLIRPDNKDGVLIFITDKFEPPVIAGTSVTSYNYHLASFIKPYYEVLKEQSVN